MHGYSTAYAEFCEDTLDESLAALTEVLAASGGDFHAASVDFCVHRAGICRETRAAPGWLDRGLQQQDQPVEEL